MEYITIYEYSINKSSDLLHLLTLGLVLILSILFVVLIKRNIKSFSLFRQAVLFFGYFFGGIAAIMFLFTLIQIPNIITDENQLKETIQNENFLIVEGEIENYQIKKISGQYFESFTIQNVPFEYSDSNMMDGFHQTSKNSGSIYKNGQFFRISYVNIEGKNIIFKIEKKTLDNDNDDL